MRFIKTLLFAAFSLALANDASGQEEAIEFFESKIRPLLVDRCYECHSGGNNSGGLLLDSREGLRTGGDSGPAMVPFEPDQSLIVDAVRHLGIEMPPIDEGEKLSDEQIGDLVQWIKMGAPDPREADLQLGGMNLTDARDWWAFQPLSAADSRLKSSQIDRLIREAMDAQGLRAVEQTDRRSLIRRATYDLTGLPPTPEEVATFLADDSPDAFTKVIDRLLASPRYGEHWGRHWLDVVRYADTAGENSDRPLPHAWRYRNWVIDYLNRDEGYDDFVRLQLSGDIIRADATSALRNEGIIATGYLATARRFGHDIDHNLHLMYEDIIDNFGKSYLALSLACARCHDHKYDPVSSADYYALFGIFDSTKYSFPGCEPRGQPMDLVELEPSPSIAPLLAEYQTQRSRYDEFVETRSSATSQLQQLAQTHRRELLRAQIDEGETVSIGEDGDGVFSELRLQQGEVLLLAVHPNDTYAADSTLVEWTLTRHDEERSTWDLSAVVPRILSDGPLIRDQAADWCFLEFTDEPRFLTRRTENVAGNVGLHGLKDDETPSACVNTLEVPIEAWTTLPSQTWIVHPGTDHRVVAVAWICPADGLYEVRGLVADAHPFHGSDGVSLKVEHFHHPKFGESLRRLGELSISPVRMPEPVMGEVAYAAFEDQVRDAQIQLRGDPAQRGAVVPRRWLTVFGGDPVGDQQGSGRAQLAEWVIRHPLAARVLVNRVWQWHFGQGLVASANDFGSRGATASHPDLLDRLALEFQVNGYQLKPLHRLIMNTETYQRSAINAEEVSARDSSNRYLSHFSRRRLSAEEIRDSLLFVAGNLDSSIGEAHPFPAESTWNFTQHDPFHAVYETNRRSVYLMVQRQRRHPFLTLFDGPDPNSSTAIREETTVPAQALYFLNNPFFHQQCRSLASRVLRQEGFDQRLELAYQLALQRSPAVAEQQLMHALIERYPGDELEQWSLVSRVLLASNEFLYLD